ncbi:MULTISPECIES: sensor histidine kinase [Cellulosilyticum]|uniref:Integral membrane sensor signal transduction histidine kinase n=1 Tax=Cellulosilyticum lentocellum (strain ATCC 49066 / DSM 5427 / NCIMB 11756 / RHM5) TaxID=642492 RepID=F2JLH1_CELLD|nr:MULTISPECIES: histidine kinase [Cellulosilyticum]ADZ82259.1 integral membrane sensor signal transduction histidine kinase [Cellulosilyticum lentocellum DSM 5427]QEH67942.1 sensor histidine kinase [Cellulosilyticum sp. WCF-2]
MKYRNVINNLKIRNKLAIIYVFCVLIPVIVTNWVVISAIKSNVRNQEAIRMQNVMDRIKYNIQSEVEGCISIASNLCTDKVINQFLIRDYTSNLEYFSDYKTTLQNNVLRYYYNSQKINQIILYTDNATIINGGSFWRIDTILGTEWYKEFVHSGKDIYLATYYDEKKKYLGIQSAPRTISLIQKLDYFDTGVMEKFVKIDLQYTAIKNEILNEKIDGDIYICNKEYVLFSNQIAENERKAFLPQSELDINQATYQDNFRVASDEWTIYIMPMKIGIGKMIKESEQMVWYLIMINLLLPTIIITLISKSFSGRIKLMELYFEKVKQEEFQLIEGSVGEDEIGDLIKSYNVMVLKIKELIEVVFKKNAEKQASELSRKGAELKALQSQVNPHFMFNTLESIRMRSLLKEENETADVIEALSQILRKSLSWNNDYICIEEEIVFVQQYANIQKYRFGDKISFSFYVMEGCEKIKIPKLSILTFVENACIHGIEGISKSGIISVAITKDEENVFIEISDSGCGMSEEKLRLLREVLKDPNINKLSECKSTGMLNALIRMNLYCENTLVFDIDSELGQGTDIMIQMPLGKIEIEGEKR